MSSTFLNISTDTTLGGNGASNSTVSSQAAVKAYVDNVASNKQNTITGAVSNVVSSNLTANRPVCTNGEGKLRVATTVTNTQLGYLSGATSNIQTQLNGKQDVLTWSYNSSTETLTIS
ncbi:MAG: hypothetical protein J5895_00785 [Alphaproteobacteria bacterium]|nr:hypothetical protein [Alphaproteobacteria bacterium]